MTNETTEDLYNLAIGLLKELIITPSLSKEEDAAALVVERFLNSQGIQANRLKNNVWAGNKYFDPEKYSILLNSHIDTVKPNKDYTRDPFKADEETGKLYGLGSNDAGGCLVSLIVVFLYFYNLPDLKFNLLLAATAEEEISGINGIEALLPLLRNIDFALVGEPTQMQMAIAEKGLMVVDCIAQGSSGHAAREEGVNAIYKAVDDIQWFRNFSFPKVSQMLGPVKMNVTIINAGTQHNVIPASCTFTADIRINDCYTHEEILEIIREHVSCEVKARSVRLKSTSIAHDHPVVKAGLNLGLQPYGSATLSDKALMPFPALKIGPGDSARSHMADEYIYTDEIKKGIEIYIQLLNEVL
jgi:acetylornithine deacetylase